MTEGASCQATLEYIAPFDWDFFLRFHAARALPGVEAVEGGRYRRVVRVDDYLGRLTVMPASTGALAVSLAPANARALSALLPRVRRAFDLDIDPTPVAAHLARDAGLAPLLARRPGLRVAGSVDGFEQAVRAILGQQISVTAARDLGGRLAARWGTPVTPGDDELRYAFPTARVLATADVASLGMPRARGRAVSALAAAVAADDALLTRAPTLEASIARLAALPGLGPWTAHYIAMRVLREPDAFPASDVGLLRALTDADGRRPTVRELEARAEAWRPWRAYAAQHLWAKDAG